MEKFEENSDASEDFDEIPEEFDKLEETLNALREIDEILEEISDVKASDVATVTQVAVNTGKSMLKERIRRQEEKATIIGNSDNNFETKKRGYIARAKNSNMRNLKSVDYNELDEKDKARMAHMLNVAHEYRRNKEKEEKAKIISRQAKERMHGKRIIEKDDELKRLSKDEKTNHMHNRGMGRSR